jgi:hypothetical protein
VTDSSSAAGGQRRQHLDDDMVIQEPRGHLLAADRALYRVFTNREMASAEFAYADR